MNIQHSFGRFVFLAIVVALPLPLAAAGEDSAAAPARAQERQESIRTALENARAAMEVAQEARQFLPWMWSDEDESAPRQPRPFLGVIIETVPRSLRTHLDIPPGVGLIFTRVEPDSPAARAGIQNDDIILEFAGQLIFNHDQLSKLIGMQEVGTPVPLKLFRKGREIQVEVELEARVPKGRTWRIPAPPAPPVPPGDSGAGSAPGQSPGSRHPGPPPLPPGVLDTIEKLVPGSIRVVVDDRTNLEVDLSRLRDTLSDLEARIERLDFAEGEVKWGDIVNLYREAANRQSVVRLAESRLSLSTEDGRVRLFQDDGTSRVVVTDPEGEVLYDGPITDDFRERLDPRAARLVQAMIDARKQLDTDLTSEESIEVREVDESDDTAPNL